MNFFASVMHLLGSGALAYITAASIRDPKTRPHILAGFQLAESGSVPFLTALSERAASEGDTWLAEKLIRHAADEQRHGKVFAHALKQLGKQTIDSKNLPDKNDKPDGSKRSLYLDTFFDGYSQEELNSERIDWIVFMGSTYIAESSAYKDFVRLANVLPEDELHSRHLKEGILSVAQDETRHAAYLLEALHRRLSAAEVQAVVDEWRTRKVNAMLAMVGSFLQGDKSTSFVKDGAPIEVEAEQKLTA